MSEGIAFSSWLKDRRRALDLTQEELAHRVGCSLILIQKIEAGERRPSKQVAELLAVHLDVPTDERADFVRFARAKRAHILPNEKSPWRTLRQHLTNLPIPPTPLFGREQDIADIVRRITRDCVRLLTLVGPPGIGKTRLALACAERLVDDFEDGVYLTALAPIHDADLVAPTIARALGVKGTAGQPYCKALTDYLADKRLLLLLDNFEQVVAAAPLVAEMLTTCPWLYILTTSRVSLHIRAERQFRVAPLAFPSLAAKDDPSRWLESPAIQIFIDRARAVAPNFSVSPAEVATLAQICVRLDGLPLAIELVAARSHALSPREMLAHIEQRLAIATAGARDSPPRHQSLRDAIAWSFELLDGPAQALFARLSVFVGGWATEMAHAICGQAIAESDLARTLSMLADASLVVTAQEADSESRWAMLETIREFAAERLSSIGQTEEIAQRHAQFFLAFAESATPQLSSSHQVEWLNRLERERGNLHAALEWAIGCGEAELALRLGGALFLFWYKQNWLIEGRGWLERALALPAAARVAPVVRQRAIHGASVLAWSHADFVQAERLAEQAHALARELGDQEAILSSRHVLANVATDRSDFARAIALHEQNLALRRERGDRAGIASSLNNLGRIAYFRGEGAQAIQYHAESLALQREIGDHFGTALALNNLGGALVDDLQELDRARVLLQESLTLSREPGREYFLIPFTLTQLGRVALYTDALERAQSTLAEALSLAREWQLRTGIAFALIYLTELALRRNDRARAVSYLREGIALQRTFEDKSMGLRYLATAVAYLDAQHQWNGAAVLLGAMAGMSENARICLPRAHEQLRQATASRVQMQLGEEVFRAGFACGYTMTLAHAFTYASDLLARN